ncbi:hypothetical protein ABIA39_003419 [Nocardia sp. GAS34]
MRPSNGRVTRIVEPLPLTTRLETFPVHTIDIESITGELGTYEVTWWIDEYVNNPFDEYDHVTSVVLGPRDRRSLTYSYGPMAEKVSRILADGIHSEASVVRWLALRGCRGIHTLHHSGNDGRIAADPPFTPDTAMQSDALRGVAFIAPEFVSEVTDPDRVVGDDIQELSYWAEGDAFGYSVARRSGEIVGSGGGYFGWLDTKDSILRDVILDDVQEYESHLIRQAQLFGAGFVGIV